MCVASTYKHGRMNGDLFVLRQVRLRYYFLAKDVSGMLIVGVVARYYFLVLMYIVTWSKRKSCIDMAVCELLMCVRVTIYW